MVHLKLQIFFLRKKVNMLDEEIISTFWKVKTSERGLFICQVNIRLSCEYGENKAAQTHTCIMN